MNLLSQIMSEEANEGALLVRASRLSNQPTLYLRRNYYRNSSSQQPPVAYKVCCDWHGGYPNRACVSLMVDKMVDVDVPLTMNYRGVNISKHKDQGCC
jgi:hypothetical protein